MDKPSAFIHWDDAVNPFPEAGSKSPYQISIAGNTNNHSG